MPPLPLCLALLLPPSARAADLLDYWSYEDYPEGDSLVGEDDWSAGFSQDDWIGYISSRTGNVYVQTTTDYNTGDYPGDWGDGGALDNWIVSGEVSAADMVLRVPMYTEDDDSVGIICRFQDEENYILAVISEGTEGSSTPIGAVGPTAAIVRIEGGSATVLGSDGWTYGEDNVGGLELSCEDDQITLNYWREVDDSWEDPDETVTATDSAGGTLGAAGFYSYDGGGYSEYGESRVLFGAVEVLRIDEDEDGVADDVDNCEEVANTEQEDGDADGIGDACDDTSEDTDTGQTDTGDTGDTDTGDSGDSDTAVDTGDTGAVDTDTGDTDTGSVDTADSADTGADTGAGDTSAIDFKIPDGKLTSCSCASAPRSTTWAGLLTLLAFVGLRRRTGRD